MRCISERDLTSFAANASFAVYINVSSVVNCQQRKRTPCRGARKHRRVPKLDGSSAFRIKEGDIFEFPARDSCMVRATNKRAVDEFYSTSSIGGINLTCVHCCQIVFKGAIPKGSVSVAKIHCTPIEPSVLLK